MKVLMVPRTGYHGGLGNLLEAAAGVLILGMLRKKENHLLGSGRGCAAHTGCFPGFHGAAKGSVIVLLFEGTRTQKRPSPAFSQPPHPHHGQPMTFPALVIEPSLN